MLIVSISVYCVDTFTAINLLAFDKWAGQIKPTIPFEVSRWIFAGCIILSFLLLFYRWVRAIRVIKRGGVAKSYLDPLAVRLQSIRPGKNGRGWKRFLVFAELTKSKKGADYVALFAHYSFEAWLRILLAEGPRQAVNALTLYSVMQLNLIPVGEHAPDDGHSPIAQFFINVGELANSNKLQAVVLFGMLWTLFIWVISMISLIVSVILYLVFLWHHIPSEDGGLGGYCRNKIDRRMGRIVRAKVDKALRKENQRRAKEEAKAAREGGGIKKQPTLPDLGALSGGSNVELSRQTTMTTLPEYSSRPQTSSSSSSNESLPSQSTLPEMGGPTRPGMPKRTVTHTSEASWSSYNSNAPLMSSAEEMARVPYDRVQTPASSASGIWPGRQTQRSMTGISQFSDRTFASGPARPSTAQSGRNTPAAFPLEPISRTGTSMSGHRQPRYPSGDDPMPPLPPLRPNDSFYTNPASSSLNNPLSRPSTRAQNFSDGQGRRTPATYVPPSSEGGRKPPAPGRLPRAYTPQSGPLDHTTYLDNHAPLPRLQTSSSPNGSHAVLSLDGRSTTPAAAPPPSGPYRSFSRDPMNADLPYSYSRQTPQPGYPPYPEDRAPPQRQNSAVDDILSHY